MINCCIWLGVSFEYLEMHGTTNTKYLKYRDRFWKTTLYVKIYKHPHSGSRVVPRGWMERRTGRHDEAK
jgi:hypothetical protein